MKYLNVDEHLFKQEEFEETNDDGQEDTDDECTQLVQENVKAHEAIYKTSKCFIEVNKYLRDCKFDDEGAENNFYSPEFAQAFLKNHLSYVLLWGRVMTFKRSKDAPRANNGPIENHFMQKKRDAREDSHKIGAFGKISCGRYVHHLSEITNTTIKSIEYDIPARGRSKNSQKKVSSQSEGDQISESGVLRSEEQYKKRNVKGPKKSVFFSQSDLNNRQ